MFVESNEFVRDVQDLRHFQPLGRQLLAGGPEEDRDCGEARWSLRLARDYCNPDIVAMLVAISRTAAAIKWYCNSREPR
jgi:hypothetical protein